MRSFLKNTATITLLAISLSGCATVFDDKSDQLTIRSNEPEAMLSVNGNNIGKGSAVYALPRGRDAIITASVPGCSDRSVPTGNTIAGATWLDLFFWPTFFVDVATGAMHKAEPTDYVVTPDCSNHKPA